MNPPKEIYNVKLVPDMRFDYSRLHFDLTGSFDFKSLFEAPPIKLMRPAKIHVKRGDILGIHKKFNVVFTQEKPSNVIPPYQNDERGAYFLPACLRLESGEGYFTMVLANRLPFEKGFSDDCYYEEGAEILSTGETLQGLMARLFEDGKIVFHLVFIHVLCMAPFTLFDRVFDLKEIHSPPPILTRHLASLLSANSHFDWNALIGQHIFDLDIPISQKHKFLQVFLPSLIPPVLKSPIIRTELQRKAKSDAVFSRIARKAAMVAKDSIISAHY